VTGWLLDTNVLSELRRPNPNPAVVGFVASRPLDLLLVSIVTFAEIRFRIERAVDGAQRAELNHWLWHKVRPVFDEAPSPSLKTSCLHGVSWSRAGARPDTPIRSPI
jgi:toxin FitB